MMSEPGKMSKAFMSFCRQSHIAHPGGKNNAISAVTEDEIT